MHHPALAKAPQRQCHEEWPQRHPQREGLTRGAGSAVPVPPVCRQRTPFVWHSTVRSFWELLCHILATTNTCQISISNCLHVFCTCWHCMFCDYFQPVWGGVLLFDLFLRSFSQLCGILASCFWSLVQEVFCLLHQLECPASRCLRDPDGGEMGAGGPPIGRDGAFRRLPRSSGS